MSGKSSRSLLLIITLLGDNTDENDYDDKPGNPQTWRRTPQAPGCAGSCEAPPEYHQLVQDDQYDNDDQDGHDADDQDGQDDVDDDDGQDDDEDEDLASEGGTSFFFLSHIWSKDSVKS